MPFCGYYICWYANLWNIQVTKDVYWDQLLFCIEPNSYLMHQVICLIILSIGFYVGSSGYCKNLSAETLMTDKFTHPFVPCLLSHPNSFGSFSSSISFLRKQHYMHPSNKLHVLCFNRLWRWTNIVSLIYGVMAILCFEWITAAIKYKLMNMKSIVEHRIELLLKSRFKLVN